jgi:parallel beta-helix repeat protein
MKTLFLLLAAFCPMLASAAEIRISHPAPGQYQAESATSAEHQVLFRGARFVADVLQPSIDSLASSGGGTVTIANGGRPYPLAAPGDTSQIQLRSLVNIRGETDASGLPSTRLSVESAAGNIFYHGTSQHDFAISNLSIDANDRGYYVFSLKYPVNVTIENVRVYNPNDAAFGHFAGTNTRYVNDFVSSDGSMPGHGFATGGNDGSKADSGTQFIHCEAHGFNNPAGGQGIQMRPPLPSYKANPAMKNESVRIVGGLFTGNRVGIWLQGSDNVLIDGATVTGNSDLGIMIYSMLEGAPVIPDSVTIQNARISHNGSNTRSSLGDAGISIARANVTIQNTALDSNLPFQIWISGSNLALLGSKLFNSSGSSQPYEFHAEGSPQSAVYRENTSVEPARWPDEGSINWLSHSPF